MLAKQSTALTLVVGPILDSTGAEYASAVIGDLSISKNGGTLTALASAASLTYIANGQYTLVLTTGNTDTLGAFQITCNKATYQMATVERQVVASAVYDILVTNGTIASQTNITAAAGCAVSSIGTDVITSTALAASAVTEIQSGLSTLTEAQVNAQCDTAITDAALATAANLATVAGYLDTEIAAILADTNELQTDWANGGRLDLILDARASQSSVDTIDGIVDSILVDTTEIGTAGAGLTVLATAANLATVAGYIDTEVAAIKAKTDQLTFTNALSVDATASVSEASIRSAIGLASANLDTQLTAIDDYLDTEVAAIKAKTDNLPASPASTSDIAAAIVTYGLDHLVYVSVAGTDIADNSIIAKLASKSVTADWDSFVNTTDSLQAIKDGGSGTSVTSFDAAALAQLSAIHTITTLGPVQSAVKLTLNQGDDYATDDSTQLQFPNTAGSWPDLTSATITLRIYWTITSGSTTTTTTVTITGTVIIASGSSQRVDVDITRANSLLLTNKTANFDLVATLADGHKTTLRYGTVTVRTRAYEA